MNASDFGNDHGSQDKFQRQIDCFSIKELFFILVFFSNNKIKKSFRDMESVSF